MTAPSTIAHYRVTSKLGEGGMGAVYRATDTKLNRAVAIKVLPDAFAADTGRMARFEREAQVLASLNHPNVAAIYGIEQNAIVMEMVEGADLRGPVPIDTAIAYAKQIAAGLEAAHEKGIVHRDLKPANIKVTPEGIVKLLDFGLAKAAESSPQTSDTMSPTLSLNMTQAGMILGTAAYMSPEQARGKPVDKRADIWAFGVVLFELLTGTMIFGGGETVTDAIAAVMTREPDWSALPAGTPPHLRRLLERCLRKDPKLRLRDIGDARLILDEAEAPAAAGDLVAGAPRNRRLPWIVAAAVFALTTLALAFLWLHLKPADPGPGAVRFPILLPAGTAFPPGVGGAEWVPSPDGRYMAFAASEGSSTLSTSLWVRPLGSESAHRLDNTEGANFPFWSPDSQSIGFFADEKLKSIPVSGGSAQTVCAVPKTMLPYVGEGGAWHRDGFIVFASGGHAPLMRVAAAGGVPATVTTLGKDDTQHSWPQFLPDGRLLYFAGGHNSENNSIYVQELGSAKRTLVIKNTTRAVWAPPGYLLFVRENTLFAQHISPGTFQVEGEPLAVAHEVVQISVGSSGRSSFAVSQNGVLAYRSTVTDRIGERQLTWRDREGKVLGTLGQPGAIVHSRLSPDEKSVALLMGKRPKLDVWVMDLASGVLSQMTRDRDVVQIAATAWSPDSQRLVIGSKAGLREVSVASGKATPLPGENLVPQAWSPDGRSILVTDPPSKRLSLLSLADAGKLQTILDTPEVKTDFRFSPDGKYVAYYSPESGQPEIYVAAFPSFAVKRKASTSAAVNPIWSAGGKELFYMALTGGGGSTIMSVEVRGGPTLSLGTPKLLFPLQRGTPDFSVSADGKRFLLAETVQKDQEATPPPQISVVLNWAADIK